MSIKLTIAERITLSRLAKIGMLVDEQRAKELLINDRMQALFNFGTNVAGIKRAIEQNESLCAVVSIDNTIDVDLSHIAIIQLRTALEHNIMHVSTPYIILYIGSSTHCTKFACDLKRNSWY